MGAVTSTGASYGKARAAPRAGSVIMVAVESSLPERTERLALRALVATDLAEHHRLFSNPDVVRYLYDVRARPQRRRGAPVAAPAHGPSR